ILPVRGFLPVLAHRDVGHIVPELHLQLAADPLLLVEGGRIEPGRPQRLDAFAGWPPIKGGETIRSYQRISIRMRVGERPIHERTEYIPAALFRRLLVVSDAALAARWRRAKTRLRI